MIKSYPVKTLTSQVKGSSVRDYQLLPDQPIPPNIISQPVKGVVQYTHKDVKNNYIPVKSNQQNPNLVTLLKGTSFSISVVVENPSNPEDVTDIANLKFLWKRDDADLYVYTQQNNGKGSNIIYFDATEVTPLINGVYTVEVANKYGTTISQPLTIQIVDTENNNYINSNVIINDSGQQGTEGWTVSDDIKVGQFEDNIKYTYNFASIYNLSRLDLVWNPNDSRLLESVNTKYKGELPFRYTTANNYLNFKNVWDSVLANKPINNKEDLEKATPNLVPNERPNKEFAQFYPSPYLIDEYNKNKTNTKRSLVSEFGLIPTYFTRDKIKFRTSGGRPTSTMTQTVDLTSIANLVDGNVPGVTNIKAHLFSYMGNGLSRYVYQLVDSNDNVVNTLNTYILDPLNWSNFIAKQSFAKYILPTGVSKIRLVPICDDNIKLTINCLDFNNEKIKTVELTGPTSGDVWAVKEKFFISAYINKLFNLVVDLSNYTEPIPVEIYNQKYFNIEPTTKTTNANLEWLRVNYPKHVGSTSQYSMEYFDNGDYVVGGFDKGAAALFGYNQNFQIPTRTRSLQVVVKFEHTSQAINNANPQTVVNGFNWDYDDIYAHHLDGNTLYEYNLPKVGLTQLKVILTEKDLDPKQKQNVKHATYFLPKQSVWNISKSSLRKPIYDETKNNPVYNYTNGFETNTNTDYRSVVSLGTVKEPIQNTTDTNTTYTQASSNAVQINTPKQVTGYVTGSTQTIATTKFLKNLGG